MGLRKSEHAAATLSAGRLQGVRMDVLPTEIQPADEPEAYTVQEHLHGLLTTAGHGEITGHKIGCTTPVMQEFLGIPNPCAGGIFGPTVNHIAAVLDHDSYLHVGVECEMAALLGDDLPPGRSYDRDSVAGTVEAIMAAIEIVDDRWVDYRSMDTPTLIADDFFGAGCVLGKPVYEWRSLPLTELAGSMRINGEVVGSGTGADILGHPFEALAWLANCVTERGTYLRAGEFVLLGSLVATRWVEKGDVVTVQVESLGRVEARFG